MKRLLLCAPILLANAAWAGPFEDVVDANARGDYATVLRIARPLAANGEAWAQASLGFMYAKGQGLVQDFAEAAKWYRLAAEQGHATAQYNLGVMYAMGQGVELDNVRAHMWFNLGAVSGNADAVKSREVTANQMTPQQVGEAQKLARECQARRFKGCN